MTPEQRKALGREIAKGMKATGIGPLRLAQRCGKDTQSVYRWRRGLHAPGVADLWAMVDLGILSESVALGRFAGSAASRTVAASGNPEAAA